MGLHTFIGHYRNTLLILHFVGEWSVYVVLASQN